MKQGNNNVNKPPTDVAGPDRVITLPPIGFCWMAGCDKGEIVESGSHIDLTFKKGAYYTLVKNQLELE